MCNGLCDVKGCNKATYMCWRPLTERISRQICEYHWLKHKDETDSFDLFDEFKFRRALGIWKPVLKNDAARTKVKEAAPSSIALPVPPQNKTAVDNTPEVSPVDSLVLNGVFFSKDTGYALLNNHVVKEGDFIEGAKVKRITLDGVVLEYSGREVKLYAGKQ